MFGLRVFMAFVVWFVGDGFCLLVWCVVLLGLVCCRGEFCSLLTSSMCFWCWVGHLLSGVCSLGGVFVWCCGVDGGFVCW